MFEEVQERMADLLSSLAEIYTYTRFKEANIADMCELK